MAKKVVVKDDELVDEKKPKKKKHVCCGCCIAILVFFLIVVAAGVGVGWYFGDKLTREYLDMSLGETLGVVGDLYWADDKKVVKNPYTDADRESFYKELKRNIMLKEDVKVDFDGALEKAVVKFMEEAGKSGPAESARALNEGEDLGDGGDTDNGGNGGESGGNDIMNIFADMIVEVLNSDNIDKARLEAYDENDPSTDTYIFNIRDRELAAFIGSLFNVVLKNADKMDELKEISEMGLDLSSVASLKQITFKATKKDGEVVKATRADITLWLGLQDAAGQALTTILTNQGYGWASSLAKSLANTLLPKNLYINVGIPLFGDAEPVVSLNDMTDADRERAYKLVNGVLKATSEGGGDEPMTVDGLLANVTESIKPVLEQAAETIDFSESDAGAVKIDLLDIAAKTASESFEGDPLTKADFLYLLQAVYSDPELQLDALEPYRYTNRYLVDGKDVYIKGGDPDKTPIDYEREFIKEIENKYALKFKDGAKLTDVLAMLGVSLDGSAGGEMGSVDLLDMIDAQQFNSLLDRNINDIKLNVTDRMLASALSGQLDGLLTGGESDFSGMTVTLDALTFVKKEEKPKNMYAMLAVEADLSGLFGSFGDGELVTRLATGLMPDKLLLTVTVDITQNREAGTSAEPVEFLLNSCANTDRALSVLEKLAPSLNLKSMSEQIDEMLNGMLDQMYKMLDINLVPSAAVKIDGVWTGNTGALVLPDIFTFVTDTVLVDESGESVVTADELKNVLRGLNDTDGVVVTPGIADDYSGFIADVVDKYYLNPDNALDSFDALTNFMSDFDTSKFRVTGTDPAVKYLVHDTRAASELEPVMTGAELGALIKEQMGDGVQDYNVKRVSTGDGSLSVVLAIDVGNLLPEDVKFLVTAQELFVTATVDMSVVIGKGTDAEPYRYDVSVKLNDMDKDTYESALKIIRFFTADFDIATQVDEFGEILYTQMQNINGSFAPSVENGDAPAPSADFFRFTERGLVMSDFYTFLANKMGLTLDGNTTADTVKNVVQGMYARSSVAELSNPNNYVYGEIVTNPGDSQWADGDYPHSGKNYSDKAFNAYLSQGVGQLGSVGIVQTTVLSAADAANTKARAIRDWLSARVESALDDTSDYLAITVQMDMGDFMTGNDKSGGFLPSSVIATIVYKYGVTGEFENAGIIFNDMTYNEYVVMQQLMGLSPDSTDPNKVNINTVENKTVEVLDALTAVMNVTLLPQVDGEGVGGVCAVLKSFGG